MMSAAGGGSLKILNKSIIDIALPISPMPYATAVVACSQHSYFQGYNEAYIEYATRQ